jgi:hypothetical protein
MASVVPEGGLLPAHCAHSRHGRASVAKAARAASAGRRRKHGAWAHDVAGEISGNSITGTFQDRPGYGVYNGGTITARIVDNCHFTVAGITVGGAAPSPSRGALHEDAVPTVALEPVPVARASNGCGGAGWRSLVRAQNYIGNTSTYWNSDLLYHPAARPFTVDFVDACNLMTRATAAQSSATGFAETSRTFGAARASRSTTNSSPTCGSCASATFRRARRSLSPTAREGAATSRSARSPATSCATGGIASSTPT